MDTLASLFNGNYAYAFAWSMIHSLWQCSLIALGLWISLSINRHQSANSRYLQGILAMGLCVATGAATFVHLFQGIQGAQISVANGLVLRYGGGLWEQVYTLLNKNLHIIIVTWCLGFSVQFARYTYDFGQALQLRYRDSESVDPIWMQRCELLAQRLEIRRGVSVKNSCRVSSICVIGHLKPVILLPIGMLTHLPREQVEALLLHELAHIRRNDYLVNTIQGLVRLLYFFNPAVLWISQRIDIERENACDDIAVAQCGSAKTYAEGLASISVLELRLSSVLAARGKGYRMLPRVTRLFNQASGVTKSAEQLASGLCALGLIFAMNVSAGEFSLIPKEPREVAAVSEAPEPKPSAQVPASARAAEPQPHNTLDLPKPAAAPAHVARSNQMALPVAPPQPTAMAQVNAAPSPKAKKSAQAKAPRPVTPAMDYQVKRAPQAPVQVAQATPAKPRKTTPMEVPLSPLETPEFNQLLIAEKLSIPTSRKIYLEPITVTFADIWMKRFSINTSTSYKAYVTSEYAKELHESLSNALSANGWQVVDRADSDSLKLRARLIDLYIFEPETAGVKQTIIAQAGQAGIELAYLSPKGQPFMKIVDHRTTGDTSGGPVVANRATNLHYFKKLMASWSKASTSYLEEVVKIVENQR